MHLMQLAVCVGITLGWILPCAGTAVRPIVLSAMKTPSRSSGFIRLGSLMIAFMRCLSPPLPQSSMWLPGRATLRIG